MQKPLRIAITSYGIVDSQSTLGMYKRIGTLVDSLIENKNTITLFADFQSKTKAHLFHPDHPIDKLKTGFYWLADCEVINQSNIFDIIHANNMRPVALNQIAQCPVVFTIASGDPTRIECTLMDYFKGAYYIPQSIFVKNVHSHLNLQWTDVIYNGVDTNKFIPIANPTSDYFLFLGRIIKDKCPHIPINIIKKLGKKYIIAGQIEDQEYFDKDIKPLLDDQIQYVGEVSFDAKISLLQNASALISPGTIAEACSNSIIESLACGTPAIARDTGSNSELVTHEKTGLIFDNDEELEKLLQTISQIDRRQCRQEAEKRFTNIIYMQNHINAYKKIITDWKQKRQ